MQTNSNEIKLNKLINSFLDEVCNLPNLTDIQWISLSDKLIHSRETPNIPAIVKLLRSFYQTDEEWVCAKGNTCANYIQAYIKHAKPLNRSKLGLKYAVDIVRFILDNKKFLVY